MAKLRLITTTTTMTKARPLLTGPRYWTMPSEGGKEKAEAKRAVWEAEEERACEEEERHRAKEEKEAKQKHKAKAGKGSEARASGSETGKVKKVVMDPGCMHCAQAQVICKFLVDSNKKCVACMWCNLLKGKCQWPRDGKDTKAGPKAVGKVNKGKKQKVNKDAPEAGPSKKKHAKLKSVKVLDIDEPKASGSRVRKASVGYSSGLEEKRK
ncbi:hypothetical protein BKA82DRAFT_27295 [Pisolithus tinctorius]|uniref:Uncharacterized protein n=1 Tax=Pisolithus tinctorius Marx 270 TaxID=870435 RepID=A0A0C3NR71_PISTI|nr:hypothetical protein BKA82DRAFT_27295 [Pisolithus tinctorius]KIO03330.1 hypothetical protein M404DRAFT_27295 [Pisolithus tinctorius Marx 270]